MDNMKVYTLKDFAQKYFESTAELARHLGRPENSLYRLNRKGAIVVVEGDKFTIHKNGETHSLTEKAPQ